VALATSVGVEHLALGERPQYGMPYPEGIAVAASAVADDASGGAHSFTINADPGFLYRLELLNLTRGEATIRNIDAITVHGWAEAKAGFGGSSFDLNWPMKASVLGTFTVYQLMAGPDTGANGAELVPMIKRFPMGAALGGGAPGVSVILMQVNIVQNTTGITNELAVVWTYWRKESLYLPGFLSAFYESPAVPPIIRQ